MQKYGMEIRIKYCIFSGLFHKGISQSGSAIKSWSFVNKPAQQAIILGEKLKCPTNDSVSLVRCLKGLDSNKIIMAHWDYLVSSTFSALRLGLIKYYQSRSCSCIPYYA